MTTIIMACLLVGMAALLLLRDSRGKARMFFDQETSLSLRGVWCLVVMLVHVPDSYQNFLQDAVGSFAYIGVTFFFMTSSYGLMLSVLKNGCSAVKGFWKRRLPKLLVPMLLANLAELVINWSFRREIGFLSLFTTSAFVRKLLVFYFLFWIVFWLPVKMSIAQKRWLLCFLTVMVSIVSYILDGRWSVEALGFLFGILLASYKKRILEFFEIKWLLKCIITGMVCLAIGVLYRYTKYIVFWGDYVIRAFLGVAITLFMLQCLVKYSIGNSVNRFLGKVSFEVYLLHGIVFSVLAQTGVIKESGVYIFLSILITVLLSVAVNFIGRSLVRIFPKVE